MTMDDRLRRELRETFDVEAEAYDRTRPVLPDPLFEDLVAIAGLAPGSRVLEIGCGTGQATLPLARRGLSITALELGPELAGLARTKLAGFPTVEVVTASFEAWTNTAGPFDAVVAVSSLHWIDPELRFTKPARLLRSGGAMIVAGCSWAAPQPPDAFLTAVGEDYRAVGYRGDPPPPADLVPAWHFPPEAVGLFTEKFARGYEFSATLSADDYVANLATQSSTHELGADLAREFLARVRRRLTQTGTTSVTRSFVGRLTVGVVSGPSVP
jgi:SAM-dependent methyltransferase